MTNPSFLSPGSPWRRCLLVAVGAIVGLLLFIVLLFFAFQGKITQIVEGDRFRLMLEAETSKGMHFVAHYEPIKRVGWLGIQADAGSGHDGAKTIVSMSGEHVTGSFNPWGFFLKRWQIDNLHFDSGTVELQKTEGTPNGAKPKGQPWYLFFWPDRVYLEDIKIDDAKVLFKLQEKESGIYHTFLEITPNGRDFEYDAHGGEFKTPMTPSLQVQHIHLLIRKPKMTCSEFVLGDDLAHPEQQMRTTGTAGLQEDRYIHIKTDIDHLKVAPWLPEKIRSHILGSMVGHLDYDSTGTGIETATASGHLQVLDGVLRDLKQVKMYVDATGSPDPGDLKLKTCEMDVKLDHGAITFENLKVECEGVFKLEGSMTIAKDKSLSGDLQLGLTQRYIKWLPTANTDIFTQTDGDYHVTTVHMSGTSKKPVQDLTPRITKVIGDHPLLALKLLFNTAGDWFDMD